jgi:hypothetical protein
MVTFPNIIDHSWGNSGPISFLMVDSSLQGSSPTFPSVYYAVVTLLLISALSFTCPQIGCSFDGWSHFQQWLTIHEAIVVQYPFWLLILVCKGHLHLSQVFPMLWWFYFVFQLWAPLAFRLTGWSLFQLWLTISEPIVIQYASWVLILVCKGHLQHFQVSTMLWCLYFWFQLWARLALRLAAPLMDGQFSTIRDHFSANNSPIFFLSVDTSLQRSSLSIPSVSYAVVTLLRVSALSFACPQINCSSDGWSLFQILLTIAEAIMVQYPFWLLFLVCKGHLHLSQVLPMLWWL